MTQATRYDPRISGLSQVVKSMAEPQTVYRDKAGNVRAEYIDGALHLYRHQDIMHINRHPAVLGNGGRGGSFGHDGRLIPLEIDGDDHKKWRRLLDPMFSPKQVARLEPQVRVVAPDGRTAYIDMGDETIRYGVEVDGFLNHMARFAADRRRSRMLAVELDWTIAHYAAEELAADLVGAARDIAAEVKRRRATAAA